MLDVKDFRANLAVHDRDSERLATMMFNCGRVTLSARETKRLRDLSSRFARRRRQRHICATGDACQQQCRGTGIVNGQRCAIVPAHANH
jgi:hypothetical protein